MDVNSTAKASRSFHPMLRWSLQMVDMLQHVLSRWRLNCSMHKVRYVSVYMHACVSEANECTQKL
jgi:hypothetical protein